MCFLVPDVGFKFIYLYLSCSTESDNFTALFQNPQEIHVKSEPLSSPHKDVSLCGIIFPI